MWAYILRRLLWMVPVLGVMLVLSFLISRSSPGDPVQMRMGTPETTFTGSNADSRKSEYAMLCHEMGLDLPVFYVELTSLSSPDTLHKILHLPTRAALAELSHRYGNWDAVDAYYRCVQEFHDKVFTHKGGRDSQTILDEIRATATLLPQTADEKELSYHEERIDSFIRLDSSFAAFQPSWIKLKSAKNKMVDDAQPWKSYIPSIRFHGFQNQFHHWLGGFLTLDLGRSYDTRRPVKQEILQSLPWSILLGGMAYMIAFFVAVALGMMAVRYQGKWQDNWSTVGLFLAHSVPSFVLAMLAITFLCSPSYLHWFPVAGISSDGSEEWPWTYRLIDYLYHLILPTLVFSVHGVASLSRQLRGSLIGAMGSDYARTARAKGLSEGKIIRYHALANSLPPLIHHITQHLPGILMGSVFIETVFSLPGMGWLVVNALHTGDHPVVVGVFSLVAVATVLSNLLADILYAFTDPRVEFRA